ncbi:hypothetical protein, partial [Klebsiella pneumoniae]|uniref:hypothetical protein n=1 Tax=Klebsiella pneumoniae TaxID=573 RepID=UPI0025A00A1F
YVWLSTFSSMGENDIFLFLVHLGGFFMALMGILQHLALNHVPKNIWKRYKSNTQKKVFMVEKTARL